MINPIVSTPQPGLFSNIITQIVLPKIVSKAIDIINTNTKELSNIPRQPERQVTTQIVQEPKPESKVRVEVNFYINDTGHEIPKESYIPIKFL